MGLRLIKTPEHAAVDGATRLDVIRVRIQEAIGWILKRWEVPGLVSSMAYQDPVTDNAISISVGRLYTRLSINGRYYYFGRLNGKFEGTGQGCD